MILADTSVRIDDMRGTLTRQTERLDDLLGSEALCIGELNLTEVLQGCRAQKDFNAAQRLFERLQLVVPGGGEVAVPAARDCRQLRSLGKTVRGTPDVVLATRCTVSNYRLLHDDRDFDAFGQHLGLRCVTAGA